MDELYFYDCNLNIKSFAGMLENPTQCYKFFWLDSIMQLVARGENEFTFLEVFAGMIADAWYAVKEYHLRLGPKSVDGTSSNLLERAVNKISENVDVKNDESRDIIIEKIKCNSKCVNSEMQDLAKNVPYRLLSSFVKELGGNNPLWSKTGKLISYFEMINKKRCLLYTIENGRGLTKKVIINKLWNNFLIDNMVTIRGWIKMKKIKYLQDRNPGVPGLIYKLEPEKDKERKLENVRKLWDCVIDINGVGFKDIYSERHIEKKYEIDHFIPWSYVANDELWNLIPMDENLNSSKNNKLPDWDAYYKKFCDNQYILNETIQTNEKAREKFEKCKQHNLNSIWPLEELYIQKIGKERFFNVLYGRLHPIYESAMTQEYDIWKNCLI